MVIKNAMFVCGAKVTTENNRVGMTIKGLTKKKSSVTDFVGAHDTVLKSVRRSLDPVHCMYVWVVHRHTPPFVNNWGASFD